jgi:hypothetical protein
MSFPYQQPISFVEQINKRFDDLTRRLYSLERDDIPATAVTDPSSDSSSNSSGVSTNAQSIALLQTSVGGLQQQMGGLIAKLPNFQAITDVTALHSVVETKEYVSKHMTQAVFQFWNNETDSSGVAVKSHNLGYGIDQQNLLQVDKKNSDIQVGYTDIYSNSTTKIRGDLAIETPTGIYITDAGYHNVLRFNGPGLTCGSDSTVKDEAMVGWGVQIQFYKDDSSIVIHRAKDVYHTDVNSIKIPFGTEITVDGTIIIYNT